MRRCQICGRILKKTFGSVGPTCNDKICQRKLEFKKRQKGYKDIFDDDSDKKNGKGGNNEQDSL
ncbi:MAG: hypothetical protein WC755_01905 [Candidatus Woesearchaeota archaeon]|jgi:hypothetical protein